MFLSLVITAVVGYLLGALPFGYLVARAKGVNIFEVGSKNPGATNVRRVLGRGPGNLVLFLDAAKGAVAVALAYVHVAWGGENSAVWCEYSMGAGDLGRPVTGLIAAIVGHSFSCFTGFRGGKSVATAAGGFAVLFPAGTGIGLVVFGVVLAVFRYVSLSSMLAAASLPVTALTLGQPMPVVVVSAGVALFVILRHRTNISRLLAGTESPVGRKAPAAPPASPTNS